MVKVRSNVYDPSSINKGVKLRTSERAFEAIEKVTHSHIVGIVLFPCTLV